MALGYDDHGCDHGRGRGHVRGHVRDHVRGRDHGGELDRECEHDRCDRCALKNQLPRILLLLQANGSFCSTHYTVLPAVKSLRGRKAVVPQTLRDFQITPEVQCLAHDHLEVEVFGEVARN